MATTPQATILGLVALHVGEFLIAVEHLVLVLVQQRR